MKSRSSNFFSFFGIAIGALLFVLVGVVAAWGDVKSLSFDNQRLASEPLSSLHCPAVITRNEIGMVSATIVNETNKDQPNRIRAVITDGSSPEPEKIETEFTLSPDEAQEMAWPISTRNAAADHFILIRVHQVATYAQPLRNASCGVFVADVPFLTGSQLILATLGLAALFSGVGLLIWGVTCTPRGWRNPGFKRWLFFTGIAFLLAVVAIVGYWGAALFIAVVWIMQGIELILYFSPLKKSS